MDFIRLNFKYLLNKEKYRNNYLVDYFEENANTFNNILNKDTYPKPELIIKVCEAFSISIDDIYKKDLSKENKKFVLGNSNLVSEPKENYGLSEKDKEITDLKNKIVTLKSQINILEKQQNVFELEKKYLKLEFIIEELKQKINH